MRVWVFRVVIAIVVIAAAVRFAPKIVFSITHVSTDDAYVQTTVVPISAEVAGRILRVYVDDNSRIAKGDSILRIDPSDYLLGLQQKTAARSTAEAERERIGSQLAVQQKSLVRAQADLAAAQTRAALAEKDYSRMKSLLDGGGISQSQFDQAETASRVAQSAVKAAQAAVAEIQASLQVFPTLLEQQEYRIREAHSALEIAKNNLQRTLVVAPVSGRVARKNVDPGKFAQPGQPLLAIVGLEDPWVLANFKETQIRSMRIGEPVEVRVDAYPGHVFHGRIDSFQAGTGSFFSLLPPENATGNFVKVTQRLPVKIAIDSGADSTHPLYPGLSVKASVVAGGKRNDAAR